MWGATEFRELKELGWEFQSTPPVWGATIWRMRKKRSAAYFNPRPPCGGRLGEDADGEDDDGFQSTPPVWGATGMAEPSRAVHVISIHAPRVGGDVMSTLPSACAALFQSTPPVWGATADLVYIHGLA